MLGAARGGLGAGGVEQEVFWSREGLRVAVRTPYASSTSWEVFITQASSPL